ncbi:hypothetical protein MTP99_002685 [Tenebrio molitor]|nr:hypothetical protein MTP99_002685 [Tenebrio molitor]
MTMYLWALVVQAHAYQVIYVTQHFKFLMYMCNALIERLGSDVEGWENLIRDKVYQEQIESKLKIIIDRHCEFIRWKNNVLMVMSNLIIPFTIGGIIVGISILLLFLQIQNKHFYMTAVVAFSTALSLIAAGQFLQDESENMLLQLVKTNWYNWNTGNRKKLVLILINAAQPINLKFSEGFVINFKLLMFMFQALYSVLSILVKVEYNKI